MLDALVKIAMTSSRDYGSDQVDCHCQKPYHDTFIAFVPVAYNCLACVEKSILHTVCPAGFCIDAIKENAHGISKESIIKAESNSKGIHTNNEKVFLDLSWKFLTNDITAEMGIIYD